MRLSLAPYAVPIEGILGRIVPEPPDETRSPFQRDRDRIIHAQAFRRLQGKTQVFIAGAGDHYRTRLTHTMEVAQIGRDIARTLGLNEDLAECIALAHDLGHPPYGHAGESALDEWMRRHGGRFEHNEQTIRVVTVLEEHSRKFAGLNLNREVVDGLRKHGMEGKDGKKGKEGKQSRGLSLEAQIVNLADEIAYTGHDCDDGIRAGIFSARDVTDAALGERALRRARRRGTSLRGALIHLLVMDLYDATGGELERRNIRTLAEVERSAAPVVRFSSAMQRNLRELRRFLLDRLYEQEHVVAARERGQEIVRLLCGRYLAEPSDKILEWRTKNRSSLPVAVKDYVAGMTDAYAKAQALSLGLIRE